VQAQAAVRLHAARQVFLHAMQELVMPQGHFGATVAGAGLEIGRVGEDERQQLGLCAIVRVLRAGSRLVPTLPTATAAAAGAIAPHVVLAAVEARIGPVCYRLGRLAASNHLGGEVALQGKLLDEGSSAT